MIKTVIFRGVRRPYEEYNLVTIGVPDTDVQAELPLYLNEVNHSPTGFEWGYLGSGPSQLAYAMLRVYYNYVLEYPDEDFPDCLYGIYQKFKEDIISVISVDEWKIDSSIIGAWRLMRVNPSSDIIKSFREGYLSDYMKKS